MANVELAQKVKAAVTAKPEAWNQHTWASVPIGDFTMPPSEYEEGEGLNLSCGTTMCLAGWTCHLAGEKIDWTATEDGRDGTRTAYRLKSGEIIEDRATELLGIDIDDAGYLFHTYDSEMALDHLDQIIESGEVYDPYRNES